MKNCVKIHFCLFLYAYIELIGSCRSWCFNATRSWVGRFLLLSRKKIHKKINKRSFQAIWQWLKSNSARCWWTSTSSIHQIQWTDECWRNRDRSKVCLFFFFGSVGYLFNFKVWYISLISQHWVNPKPYPKTLRIHV